MTLTSEVLKAEALRRGFSLAGVTRLVPSDHEAFLRAWLAAGHHGEMAYLAREDAVERRIDPANAWPGLRSAIVVAHNYYVEGDSTAEHDPSRGVIARYARGRDYHKVMKKSLLGLLRWIEEQTGQELSAARAYVDTGPVLERELARRAGLGWFGRNTMLLNPRIGSFFFIGALLLELDIEPDEPFVADHCGTCSACVHACPTRALLGRDADGAPIIDATRCISYLTIEHRGAIPHELRPLMGNRIYGCDICQDVCPWNGEKFVQISALYGSGARGNADAATRGRGDAATLPNADGATLPGTDAPSLIELLGMDESAWKLFSVGSAMRRAKRAGFLRNVAIALGNSRLPEAVPVLAAALRDVEPLVRGHAAWALGRIGSAAAVEALGAALNSESDASVVEELSLAIAELSGGLRTAL